MLVHISPDECKVHQAVAKYNDKEMKISKRVLMKQQFRVYYELEGAKLNGIPLAFVGEWLIPLDERSE